jgi:serine protease AprX
MAHPLLPALLQRTAREDCIDLIRTAIVPQEECMPTGRSGRLSGFVRAFALAAIAVVSFASPHSTVSAAPKIIDQLLSQALQSGSALESVEAIVTFASKPSLLDLSSLTGTGVQVSPFRHLPMVAIKGTRLQVAAVTKLINPRIVSIYLNRSLTYYLDESTRTIGANQVWDSLGVTGAGVTVAVLDSGVDAMHADLPSGSKVVQNVKIASDPFGLTTPIVLENLATTDTSSGHGTHCASTIAGTAAASGGRFRGVAPGAQVVGIGAGEVIVILSALEGFDWILDNQARYNIRVVSNSWGTTGEFDPNDPVNVASKMAHDRGIVVVFAAGNEGPGENTLNPYSVAPWVIGVAAGNKDGQTLADFSSRGIAGSAVYQPTITAPGVDIVAARASTGVITVLGLPSDVELGAAAVSYTTMSGTSMATPHVAGVVALMLEAAPNLTPTQVKATLQNTATAMPGYAAHQVGSGYVNALTAVTAVR